MCAIHDVRHYHPPRPSHKSNVASEISTWEWVVFWLVGDVTGFAELKHLLIFEPLTFFLLRQISYFVYSWKHRYQLACARVLASKPRLLHLGVYTILESLMKWSASGSRTPGELPRGKAGVSRWRNFSLDLPQSLNSKGPCGSSLCFSEEPWWPREVKVSFLVIFSFK